MNLLKELKPFAAQLDHFKGGYGITDTIAINKLADIWDRFADTRKKEIYGSDTVIIPKTKTSCASCIKDMMNMLINWRRIVEGEGGDLVEFKSVKQANVTEVSIHTNLTVIIGKDSGFTNGDIDIDGVKKQLTERGIKYHHRMKLPKLLELLNG